MFTFIMYFRGGIRRRHREEEEDDSETPVVRKVERRVPQQDAMDMEVDFPDADQSKIYSSFDYFLLLAHYFSIIFLSCVLF